MNVLEYKCPSCKGALKFNAASQKLVCDSCKNEYEPEALEALANADEESKNQSGVNWKDYDENSGSGNWKSGETDDFVIYACPSCGGEIVGTRTTAATSCPYCLNPAIITKQFEGSFRPDFVIPFAFDKKSAKQALLNHCKRKPLLPKEFKSANHIEELNGIYVPFWLFDCDISTNISYDCTRVSAWSDKNYRYTKTDHFLARRAGDMTFDKIPADGSKKMDDTYMEAIEPFDYSGMVDFGTAFLSGYLAEKYDVKSEECRSRIDDRVKQSAADEMRKTVNGYARVTPRSQSVLTNDSDVHYALMPVWMLNTKYKNKIYGFAMNGQTGKFIGKLPISWGRAAAWFFSLLGGITLVAAVITYLILVYGG